MFCSMRSLLAFILSLASFTFAAWLEAVGLLFIEEVLFALVVFNLRFFVATFELFTSLALSETDAPSVLALLSGLVSCSDFELSVVSVLNSIIDTGSLAGVFPAGLVKLPMAAEGKDVRTAVVATSAPWEFALSSSDRMLPCPSLERLLMLVIVLFVASIGGGFTLLLAFENGDSCELFID